MVSFKDYLAEAERTQHDLVDPSKPYGLANPRIVKVGDDPRGIFDFVVVDRNILGIYPFGMANWSTEQRHARDKGYMLKYVGSDPAKAEIAQSGDAPKLGRNMSGEPLKENLNEMRKLAGLVLNG